MKYILFIAFLYISLLWGATQQQLEDYLSVSNAQEQLVELESQYTAMQKNFADANTSAVYDTQLLTIRFQEYLLKNLSEDEMDEILNAYKNLLLLRFASVTSEFYDQKEIERYIASLPQDPEKDERIEIVTKISQTVYSKENIIGIYEKLIEPLYKNGIGADQIDPNYLKNYRKTYIEMMQEAGLHELLFATRDFSLEELEALYKTLRSPPIQKEIRTVFGAIAYALEEFFSTLQKRFNAIKHSQHATTQPPTEMPNDSR